MCWIRWWTKEPVLRSYVTVWLSVLPLCILHDLIHAVISSSQKGSARHSAECQGPAIKVSVHCSSPDILLHLQIIASALRHVRMAACKSTNELLPPPPFFSFAVSYFTCMFLFLFPFSTYSFHVSIPGLHLLFFSLSFRFFLFLSFLLLSFMVSFLSRFPVISFVFITALSSCCFSLHFPLSHYCSQFVLFLSDFRCYVTPDWLYLNPRWKIYGDVAPLLPGKLSPYGGKATVLPVE